MSIIRRSLFGPADNAPSSGDGGDGATVPASGNRNPNYVAPVTMPRQSTASRSAHAKPGCSCEPVALRIDHDAGRRWKDYANS